MSGAEVFLGANVRFHSLCGSHVSQLAGDWHIKDTVVNSTVLRLNLQCSLLYHKHNAFSHMIEWNLPFHGFFY